MVSLVGQAVAQLVDVHRGLEVASAEERHSNERRQEAVHWVLRSEQAEADMDSQTPLDGGTEEERHRQDADEVVHH